MGGPVCAHSINDTHHWRKYFCAETSFYKLLFWLSHISRFVHLSKCSRFIEKNTIPPTNSNGCLVELLSATQAVEQLIHEYYKLVFHTIYGLTGDWEESQDLTQDTFHQALRGIDAARAASGEHFHAKAWLLRIALN